MRKVEPTFDRFFAEWQGVVRVRGESFVCSNCSADAAPHAGYRTNSSGGTHPMILICPRCQYPTLLVSKGVQIPGAPLGRLVEFLPPNVERFYSEARRCGTVDGWSAVALLAGRS